jgi:type I restriction enzyme, S subunit
MRYFLPDAIPHGWAVVPLGDVLTHYSGNSKLIKGKQFSEAKAGLFQGYSASGQDVWLNHYEEEGPAVIISAVGARCGKCFLANGKWSAVANTHVLRFDTDSLDHRYLWYLVNDEDFWVKGGSGQPFVKTRASLDRSIALPPLPEQHRIVAKIEALFSELDAGQDSLTRAQAQLKLYRQSLLKAAFQGRLTADWRKANPDKLDPPETLLARIRSERDARYKQALDDWQSALTEWRTGGEVGRKPAKPKLPRDFRDDFSDIEIDLPELLHGWAWGRLGYATCGVEYGTSAKSSVEGDVPVIRMGNLQNGLIDWTDLVFTSDEDEVEQYLLSDGDVLFNRTNSPELVGKTAIYRGERPALFAGYLVRVNQIDTIALPEYICYFLNSHQARRHGDTVKTDGVNQSNINGNKLQEYPFPFCAIEEQAQLILILDEKISAINAIETEITTALAKLSALRQSILKKAFSGQLVPQDPTDEPAAALLSRLRNAAPTPRRKTKA